MSQSKPGPFLKRFFIPDTHIERLALERLESLGLMPTSPAPVAVEKYCERRWGWPEDYVDLPPGILGAAAFTESGLVKVAVSRELAEDTSRTGRVRTRSSLAHEIGHGELHEDKFIEKLRHDREQLDFFSVGPEEPGRIRLLCREEQMRRPRRDEWWEIQANMFMAALLLPRPLLRRMVEAQYLRFNRQYIQTATLHEEVANVFEVSFQMAKIAVDGVLASIRKEEQQLKTTVMGAP